MWVVRTCHFNRKITCFSCGSQGHKSKSCPNLEVGEGQAAEYQKKHPNSKSLRQGACVAHLNINSLLLKINQVSVLLGDLNIDILCLNETKLI